MSLRANKLRAYCVSRPQVDYFARFFNGYSNFQPHCVSRRLPVDSAQGIRPERSRRFPVTVPNQPSPQPVLTVIVGVASPPTPARQPVALLLTARVAADVLAVAGARVREEPLPTDPARTFASHAALRAGQRPAKSFGRKVIGGSIARSESVGHPQVGGWVNPGEQRWVDSRER